MKIVKKCISLLIVFLLVFQCVMVNIADAVESESVRVQMFNDSISNSTNTIYPHFKITNIGTKTLSLSDIKVRYYFTAEGNKAQNFWCDHSGIMRGYNYIGLTSMVTGNIKTMTKPFVNADSYIEIGFTNSAGDFLPNDVVEIQCRIAKADWSNYDQSNDFSFNSTAISFSDFENVSLFIGGNLIFGKIPGSSDKAITATTTGSISGSGNIINVPIGTKVSTLKAGLTVSSGAYFQILEESGGNIVSSPDTTDVTSTMVVKVVEENSESVEYSITMAPTPIVKLTTPSGITWDSTIPGKAKWNPVSNAISYNVQLKKDDVNQGSVVTSTGIEYDFTNDIIYYGNGSYTFTVKAIGDKINFTDSDESSDSSDYTYTIPLSEACDVVGLISPLGGVISGSAIYASVSNGVESQLINVNVSDDAEWKLYSDLECTDENEIKNKTMTLSLGDNIAYIKTTAQNLVTYKVYMVKINRAGNSSSGTSSSSSVKPGTAIIVNGKSMIAAKTVVSTTKDGRSNMTITVDTNIIEKILENKENGLTLTIPMTNGSDVSTAVLSGQLIKSMENLNAVVEIKTELASYTIPVSQFNINSLLDIIGTDIDSENVMVEIEIAKPTQKSVKLVASSAEKGKFTIVLQPIEFNLRCTYDDKTIDISKFNSYVERILAIPEGVDTSKITTGVIIDADGAVRHVPTKIIAIDGKYYAKINSLTNSIYALVWNPVKFDDVNNHWAKDAINDMGARLIISGSGNNNFEPNRDITRAEFAAIIINALGIKPGTGNSTFDDVNSNDWYSKYIEVASEYGIVSGYGDGKFGPNDKITSEQAMAMIERTMKITELKIESGEAKELLSSNLAPLDEITRAEVAVIIQRLLQKSGLI